MKLDAKVREIKTNVEDSVAFSIENNPAAFKILTSNLYKYPIRAIIRELSCNAIDANRQSNEPINNWDLHMPTPAESYFYIRDNGPGLSQQDVMQLYTTFFKSTKSDNNDMTGMFGLGSKVPFAYTNQFTIESIYKGVKTTYSAYFNESGIPSITMVGDEKSKEHSGVKVTFFVESSDISTFSKELKYCAAGWGFLPNIVSLSNDVKMDDLTRLVEAYKGSYVIQKDAINPDTYNSFNFVEMGNVLYSLAAYELNSSVSEYIDSLLSMQKIKNNGIQVHDFIIHLPIGSVQITPSREELHYTDSTKNALVSYITNFYFSQLHELFKQNNTSLRSATRFFRCNKLFGYKNLSSYIDRETYRSNWGGLLYENTLEYLNDDNKVFYDDIVSVYNNVFDKFEELPFEYPEAIMIYAESDSSWNWRFHYSVPRYFEQDANLDIRNVFLCADEDDVKYILLDDDVRKHIHQERGVSIYMKNRLYPYLDSNGTSGFKRKYFIFLDAAVYDRYKDYLDVEVIANFDKMFKHTSVKKAVNKRDVGKVDVLLSTNFYEPMLDVPISNLKGIIKKEGVKHVFAVASKRNGQRASYSIYPANLKDVQNGVANITAHSLLKARHLFFSSLLHDTAEKFMVITTTPKILKDLTFPGIKVEDPFVYSYKALESKYDFLSEKLDHISVGFFRKFTEKDEQYFLSYDWPDDLDIYKVAKATFESRPFRDSSLAVISTPSHPSWDSKRFSYNYVIEKKKKQLESKIDSRRKMLAKVALDLVANCPMLDVLGWNEDILSEGKEYFYNGLFSLNNKLNVIIDYIASCYGVKKKGQL